MQLFFQLNQGFWVCLYLRFLWQFSLEHDDPNISKYQILGDPIRQTAAIRDAGGPLKEFRIQLLLLRNWHIFTRGESLKISDSLFFFFSGPKPSNRQCISESKSNKKNTEQSWGCKPHVQTHRIASQYIPSLYKYSMYIYIHTHIPTIFHQIFHDIPVFCRYISFFALIYPMISHQISHNIPSFVP